MTAENARIKSIQVNLNITLLEDLSRFFLIFLTASLVVAGFFGLLIIKKTLNIAETNTSLNQLAITPFLVSQYLFCLLPFVCFCAWWKNGFGKLKTYSQKGLIYYCINSLICSLIFITALFSGISVIIGLFEGYWSVTYFIWWLTFGLAYGLVMGLSIGLIREFLD